MTELTALNKPTLADILQELIKGKGLSVSELARRVNIPQPTVQRIATGTHSRPHSKTLTALASFFEITLDQLCGFEPIPWLSHARANNIRQIPILSLQQALEWPNITTRPEKTTVIDIKVDEQAYALAMPDGSMEPLIPQGSILILDTKRTPQYRSIVAVKLKNHTDALIRQLINDAKNCYIKPLSRDFEQFTMVQLGPHDSVVGVVVEVRLHCEKV